MTTMESSDPACGLGWRSPDCSDAEKVDPDKWPTIAVPSDESFRCPGFRYIYSGDHTMGAVQPPSSYRIEMVMAYAERLALRVHNLEKAVSELLVRKHA